MLELRRPRPHGRNRWTIAVWILGCVLSCGAPVSAQDWTFTRSDCNGDGGLNVGDAIFFLEWLFDGGSEPPCLDACDSNDSGTLNLPDGAYIIFYIFMGGPEPPAPFPDCGPDPTADGVDCVGPLASCPQFDEPPTIVSTPVTTGTEGVLYEYPVEATDPDPGDVLTYSLPVAPPGASVDPSDGEIFWLPDFDEAGFHPFTVRVTDPQGLFDEQSFVVEVANVNLPPSIESTPVTVGTEGEIYLYDADATDPDVGDTITYSLPVGPLGASVDPVDGEIIWIPDFDDAGSHPFTVRATDLEGLFDEQSFVVEVANVNLPPSIESTPVTVGTEGELYLYDVDATDPDVGDTITYSLPVGPLGASVDPADGEIIWIPDFDDAGSHPFTVRATDAAGAFDDQSFVVEVANVNLPPSIVSTPVTSGTEGEIYFYDVDATDPDAGDVLTHSLIVAPPGATIDPTTGSIQWVPDFDQEGAHPFGVRVADLEGAFDEQFFTVDVENVNLPPSIGSDPVTLASEGHPYQYAVMATDPDVNDTLVFSLPVAAPGATIDEVTGVIDWLPGFDQAGLHPFTVRVADTEGLTDEQMFTVEVIEGPFVDHFDGPSLDADLWTAKTAGAGLVQLVGESVLDLQSPGPADASFVQFDSPLDLATSQTWVFCVRRVGGDNLPHLISLWSLPAGEEPSPDTTFALSQQIRASVSMVFDGPQPSIRFSYFPDGAGVGHQWAGEPLNVWQPPGIPAAAIPNVREGDPADWYVVLFQLDASAGRFRFAGFHAMASTIGDTQQGLRLLALTDWVDLSGFEADAPIDDLWLTVGDRDGESFSGYYQVEWIRAENAPATIGVVNARASLADSYTLRNHRATGTQFVPAGRGDVALPLGSPGTWDSVAHRKQHLFRDDDGTFYLFYEGFDASGSAIGVATAPAPDGPWTPVAGNPVLPRTVLPGMGAAYDVVTAPWIVKDPTEPDSLKLWRMFFAGEIAGTDTHRLFLATAPAPGGPWTLEPGPGVDASLLSESGLDDWRDDGVNDPLVWWNPDTLEWNMLYAGLRVKDVAFQYPVGWSVGFATSLDLVNWVEDPGNPIIAAPQGAVRSLVASSGNTVTVSDATPFEQDVVVFIRNELSAETWGISRVRRIAGNQLELYHIIGGLDPASPNSSVAFLGGGSITPTFLTRDPGGAYRLYVTAFQPFIQAPGAFGNAEMVGSLTAPSMSGPWTWDHLANPAAPFTIWGAERAVENLRLVHGPVVK